MAKNAYIGVGGVAKKVKKVYVGINGKARRVKKAYIGVNGVARQFFSSIAFVLKMEKWDGRNGCTNDGELTDQQFYAYTAGGTGTGWSTNELRFVDSKNQRYLFPAGTVVKFKFTGTRSGSNSDFLFRVFTTSNDAMNSKVYEILNKNVTTITTYTFTQDAYMYFTTSIGGVNFSTISASITVTYLEIDGDVFIGA